MHVLWLGSVLGTSAAAAPAVQVAAADGANLQRPHWSPDGKKLSYEANYHDEKRIELWMGDPTTRRFDQVRARSRSTTNLTQGFSTTGESGSVAHEIAFAPAALGAFVYAASNDLFDYDLYISSGAVSEATPIAAGSGADGGARWSPDGSYIAFTSARTGEGDLYLLDTKQIEAPPRRLTTQANSSELYVDWGPDGRTLVFVAHSSSGDNLWVLPAIGANPSRLTVWQGNQIRPRWAPVGRQVAFYANHDDPDRFDLYVVEVGGAPRLIARGVYPDTRGPAWTPDGQHIVYVADDDANYDPIRAVRVADPTKVATLPLGTVGNGDLDLAVRAGVPTLAVVSQGLADDARRDFKRLFVAPLPPLP
ncbi:MAG: hypothetical protein ABMA64_36775 [Myxococcota bacterium]